MKKIFFVLCMCMFFATFAFADDYIVERLGDYTFVSGDNGYQGIGTQLGDTYFYDDNT